jgi:CysZ protein
VNIEKLNSPHYSITCLLRGLRLLASPDFRRFVWIPLAINLVLYGLAFAVGVHYFEVFMDRLLPAWLEFLRWLLWPIFGLSFLLIIYFSFTILANLIGSPFYGRLAEKLIVSSRGRHLPESREPWAKVLAAGMWGEVKRWGYFVTRAVPLLVLFLIPGLNLLAPFLWLAFSAWFMAQEYMAYPLEVQGFGFDVQRRILKKMRFGVFGFGGATMFGLTIPGLNILIPPAAVIGATLYFLEAQLEDKSATDSATR